MKYLLFITWLFVLLACDKNSSESQSSGSSAIIVETTATAVQGYPDQPLAGKVARPGLYRLVRSAGVVDSPITSTGKAVSKPVVQLVKTTERIPLIKGAQMYLQYRLWYFPNQPAYVDLRRVLKHPAMTLPDGSVSTGSDFMVKRKISSNQVIAYTGYGLDEDYELVEGDWSFEIWYQDEKLIEQKFTTYKPEKEELETLKSVLLLGNNVLNEINPVNKTETSNGWPRVVVKQGSH